MMKKWVFYMWLDWLFIVPAIALNFFMTLRAGEWFFVPGIISFVLSFIPLMIWFSLWGEIKDTTAGDVYLCSVFSKKSLSALPIFLIGYCLIFHSNNVMALLVGTPIITLLSSMVFLLVKKIDLSAVISMDMRNNFALSTEGFGGMHSLTIGEIGYTDTLSQGNRLFVSNVGVEEELLQSHHFYKKSTPEFLLEKNSYFESLNVEINPSSGLPVFGGIDTDGNPYGAKNYNLEFNPSSGLPMTGNVDIDGNPYGVRGYHD